MRGTRPLTPRIGLKFLTDGVLGRNEWPTCRVELTLLRLPLQAILVTDQAGIVFAAEETLAGSPRTLGSWPSGAFNFNVTNTSEAVSASRTEGNNLD